MGTQPLAQIMERDAVLSDGRTIHIRMAKPTDLAEVERFHAEELNDTSTYYRFLGMRPALPQGMLQHWVDADGVREATVVAVEHGHIVAIALYQPAGGNRAEIAFAVADRLQHRGIATVLLEDLAVLARAGGYGEFVATTIAGNRAMSSVFHNAGLHHTSAFVSGSADFVFQLDDVDGLEAAADTRDRVATALSLRPVLAPQHVVVFGASASKLRPGNSVLRNLRASFVGEVSVVHPSASEVDGLVAYRGVADIAGPIDLAIVATPAATVADVIDECGAVGIPAAVILSAGFSEIGPVGVALEAEVLRRARTHGMRIVGPNCFGVANPACGLDTTFGSTPTTPGSIAFGSQSGGLGIALLAEISRRGLGISSFVSLGNKADVSGNDLLCYLGQDPATNVIALYLESFGNPRKFARLTRQISQTRPIVALKGGRSESGRRGARSHTAALTTNDKVVDALFAHGGVIRARTMEELIDIVSLLDAQPLPSGRRIAIIGNAGGPLILAADAAEASGLEVDPLSDGLQKGIMELVPNAAATANPVDVLATASPSQISAVIDLIAASAEVDLIVVVTVQLGRTPAVRHDCDERLPVVLVSMGATPSDQAALFSSPERAVQAMSRVVDYAEWRGGWSAVQEPDEAWAAGAVVAAARLRALPDGWVDAQDMYATLADLGVTTPGWAIVSDRNALTATIATIGYPVVLKADAVDVLHKSAAGGVVRAISSPDKAVEAFDGFVERFGSAFQGALIQHEVPPGPELIIGLTQSDTFGALLLVGAGGTGAELLADQVVLVVPTTRAELSKAIRSLRMGPIFEQLGAVDALADVACRLGRIAGMLPRLVEMDLNPVIVSSDGVVTVDARARLSNDHPAAVPLRGLRPAHTR